MMATALGFLVTSALGNIITIPTDYSTIQAGIDTAQAGDTVLVLPGTYSENLNYHGKSVVVGSLYLTTGDTGAIAQTIIDGNFTHSVIRFENGEDSTAVLCGATVTNGWGANIYPDYWGGGISVVNGSNPTLIRLVIRDNAAVRGGGILCADSSNPRLTDVIIADNSADYGGGMFCVVSSPIMENVIFRGDSAFFGGAIYGFRTDLILNQSVLRDNRASRGAGLACYYSSPVLNDFSVVGNRADGFGAGLLLAYSSPLLTNGLIIANEAGSYGGALYLDHANPTLAQVSITNNRAALSGGGLYLHAASTVTFDSDNRCNLYLNQAYPTGMDVYIEDNSSINVIVDTFTVLYPTEYHAYPLNNISFDILHARVTQVSADLYVSPLGNNTNSGLSPEEPLKNIFFAQSLILADSTNPHTIYLSEGIYSATLTGEFFPIDMVDYVSLAGLPDVTAVLDAEGNSRVIQFDQVRGATLANITVTGGNADWGAGLYLYQSDPIISGVTITGNSTSHSGGGMACIESSPQLVNTDITDNSATQYGGGVYCSYANPDLINVRLRNNAAGQDGGGLYCLSASPNLAGVTIAENNAAGTGGGVYATFYSLPTFDPTNRSNIYLNTAAPLGNDLASDGSSTMNVVVDTFTVLYPTDYYAFPLNRFTFDILHARVAQVNADLYVSPEGDNGNSGLTPAEPLRTILYALSRILADAQHPRTLHLLPGRYSPSTNGESFPVNLLSHVSLVGAARNSVILDAEGQGNVITIDGDEGVTVANLTITGGFASQGGGILCNQVSPRLINLTITGNTAANYGGGLACIFAHPTLTRVVLQNNQALFGGGIYCYGSNPQLERVAITVNQALGDHGRGGGLYVSYAQPRLIHTTFSWNFAGELGGAIFCYESHPLIVNSILWSDAPQEIAYSASYNQNSALIAYSDLQGGSEGIVTNNHGAVLWQEGNLTVDPQFIAPDQGNFELGVSSPCINNGTAFFVWETDTLVAYPDSAYVGAAPDMGAFEYPTLTVEDPPGTIPYRFVVYPTYPNPFNATTTFTFALPGPATVTITIFNVQGRQIATLDGGLLSAGIHRLTWDAEENGSGLYLYRVQAGAEIATGKCLLVK
jgi:hypothetical protein